VVGDVPADPSAGHDGPDLSVVVPARDAAAVIGAQLAALSAQEWDGRWEVVVVDNGSADATASVVRAHMRQDPRVRLVSATGGTGPAHARNVGAQQAAAEAIAFCDADDVVAPGWLAAMGDALRDHAFVTGPLELDLLNPAWLAESRGRAFAGTRPTYDGLFPYASSCNVGLRREAFDRVGGFDETMPVGEDIDLSMRLWQAGIDLHFSAGALVHYRYRASLRAVFHQARVYGSVRPVLLERLRAAGHSTPAPMSGARNWLWLLRHLGSLRSRAGRARWLWVAGTRVGNAGASLRVRRLYL
jgi:glycosyltransferase involved in cell wall biosynthesis